jgi:selenocysteine-specific elongation factor
MDSSQSFVIGTAGHVDHGKSTLVKALTGIDPDRLAEEKARSMTIDLGFAWLSTPAGRQVSIVDVPGHERFIKNMLAGVGGIDAALLIVAADEGPMPQTSEHLAILDLLGLEHGIVVLTKRDAVDSEWLDMVTEETRDHLVGTSLEQAPIVPVSAITGDGLSELTAALDALLSHVTTPSDGVRPRLPIDRVFTVAGFGTVATGTLIGGGISVGQELHVYPAGRPVRVRGLQTHRTKVDGVGPGSRVAVNLTGVGVDDLQRGDVLAPPRLLSPSQRLDVRLRLLPAAPVDLEQNDELDFFSGASELPARVTLLDREQLAPGEEGWVQIRFQQPVTVMKGDRFIVRRPSPSETIGGGEVIDPNPPRHRRFRPEVLAALDTLAAGSPEELVLQTVIETPLDRRALGQQLHHLTGAQIDDAIATLIQRGDIRKIGVPRDDASVRPGEHLLGSSAWRRLVVTLTGMISAFHETRPLRRGIPKEEVRGRLRLGPGRLFDDVIATAVGDGVILDRGQVLSLPSFRIDLDPSRQATAERFLTALAQSPYAPPSPGDHGVDPDLLGALVDLGKVVRVAEGVVYDPASYAKIERDVIGLIEEHGRITLAEFRDHFQTSRKYAQATLEYLDQRRITRRVGDARVRYAGADAGVPGLVVIA